jgi:hypothetical protein
VLAVAEEGSLSRALRGAAVARNALDRIPALGRDRGSVNTGWQDNFPASVAWCRVSEIAVKRSVVIGSGDFLAATLLADYLAVSLAPPARSKVARRDN